MTTTSHKTTNTTTCAAAEILWDEPQATAFRKLARLAVGRDCLCHEDEPCPILPASLTVTPAIEAIRWHMRGAKRLIEARMAATT